MSVNRTLFSMSSWKYIGCLLWFVIFSWISVKWTDWEYRDSGSLWNKCRTHSLCPPSSIIQQHVHADNYQTYFDHPDETWSQGNEHKRAGTQLLAGPQLIRPLVPDAEISCLLATAMKLVFHSLNTQVEGELGLHLGLHTAMPPAECWPVLCSLLWDIPLHISLSSCYNPIHSHLRSDWFLCPHSVLPFLWLRILLLLLLIRFSLFTVHFFNIFSFHDFDKI